MSPEMVSAATRPSPLACLSTQHRCTLRNRALRKVSSVPQRATPTTRSTKRAAATPALSKPICQSSDRLERPSSKLRAVGASAASAPTYKKVLVLGGSGYVGSEVCRQLLSRGYTVVSVSRRGTGEVEGVDWRAGDVVADPDVVERILAEGGFDGVMHTIGMLLEGEANKFASGSGSVPTPGSTYDQVRLLKVPPLRQSPLRLACVISVQLQAFCVCMCMHMHVHVRSPACACMHILK